MTPTKHTVLARMSDSEPQLGADLTGNANVLSSLRRAGFIRMAQDAGPLVCCMWEITPKGLAALMRSVNGGAV